LTTIPYLKDLKQCKTKVNTYLRSILKNKQLNKNKRTHLEPKRETLKNGPSNVKPIKDRKIHPLRILYFGITGSIISLLYHFKYSIIATPLLPITST